MLVGRFTRLRLTRRAMDVVAPFGQTLDYFLDVLLFGCVFHYDDHVLSYLLLLHLFATGLFLFSSAGRCLPRLGTFRLGTRSANNSLRAARLVDDALEEATNRLFV